MTTKHVREFSTVYQQCVGCQENFVAIRFELNFDMIVAITESGGFNSEVHWVG